MTAGPREIFGPVFCPYEHQLNMDQWSNIGKLNNAPARHIHHVPNYTYPAKPNDLPIISVLPTCIHNWMEKLDEARKKDITTSVSHIRGIVTP